MAPDPVITTGIDKLMDYIEGRDEVEVSDAVRDLGVSRDTVITWANALEDAGLIEMRFSARRGRVLVPVSGAVTDETLEEVRAETEDALADLQDLQATETELEQFEDLLDRIEEGLDASEKDVEGVAEALGDVDDLEAARAFLDDIETAEEDIKEVHDRLDDAISGLKVLERLVEQQHQEGGATTGKPGLLTRLRRMIPFIGGEEERFKCEECGKDFETEHGLKTHRGIAHDE